MKFVGRTTDGRPVVGGLITLYETHGLPLTLALDECQRRRWQPGFYDMYWEAMDAGWSHDAVCARVLEAVKESYGLQVAMVVEQWYAAMK